VPASPAPPDPFATALAAAARRLPDPLVRRWLLALAEQGETAGGTVRAGGTDREHAGHVGRARPAAGTSQRHPKKET
jgi:hypothetical protein